MSETMVNKSEREALRGAEVHAFDFIFEVLTSEQWAEWLKAPLERAAAKGKRELAQKLLGAGAEIGDALHEAIRGGHREIVNNLLDSGALLAAKTTNGHTPLHIAALQGETEIAELLLLKGADKDMLDNAEMSSLYLAVYRGHVATAQALLAAGANVSLGYGRYKKSVMHVAAQKGHVDILRAVIQHGADVDAVNINQRSALHYASNSNKVDAIDVLVEAGAKIEARSRSGSTPLHYASDALSREALLSLLKHGANVNAQGNSLQTPLMMAAAKAGKQGAAEVVDSLLRAGADETIVDDEGNNVAFEIGANVEEAWAEDIERVDELLANASADRAWRRRGYLVLCRSHTDRMQHSQKTSGTRTARSTDIGAKSARAGRVAGNSTVHERAGGDWTAVVARVLRLQEEGIFRTIVGYL